MRTVQLDEATRHQLGGWPPGGAATSSTDGTASFGAVAFANDHLACGALLAALDGHAPAAGQRLPWSLLPHSST